MIYQSCSIDEVIGRVIRNTRVQDTTFIIDMHEWIPEAMDLMRTQQQYFPDYKNVDIKFHKGKLPCGLVYIEAVEWCGLRLSYGNSVKNIKTSQQNGQSTTPTQFTSVPYKAEVPTGNYAYTSTIVAAKNLPEAKDHYYQIELGHILTSFETGTVRIHFVRTPVDSRGLPLIPDHGDYKEALYWYNRAKMIESGFNDKIMSWEQCMERFEKHAAIAVTDIEYPSPDQMQHRVNTLVRFIPPEGYFENFFRITEEESPINRLI